MGSCIGSAQGSLCYQLIVVTPPGHPKIEKDLLSTRQNRTRAAIMHVVVKYIYDAILEEEGER